LREETALNARQKFAIKGGFQCLTDAFVKALKKSCHVTLKKRGTVERIVLHDEKASVHWRERDGRADSEKFDRIICAVPAPAALRIEFDPPLPVKQRRAFAGISYLSAAKSGAYFRRRFWETDPA